MQLKTTKDRILDLLKREVRMTVGALSERLEITDMAVRKHLLAMEKDGLIVTEEIRQPMGRPVQSYTLSAKGELLFPKSYEGLSVEFLQDIQALYGSKSVEQLFQNREKRLTKEYTLRMQKKSHQERMQELQTIQNEKGYMADITKIDDNSYELIEYNCPIMAVAKEYKVACKCETSMFKNVLQTENVNRTSCKTEGNDHCRFQISF
ncbi:helix-turn-helix transcriptional regulator [Oceanobacillus jordanicus]|uniref:Transcriptional regulator n=1 Tax=Oceanobacillus jordanicus TaxID=2867266 RepID=A0AAW5B0M0_9BACI|nr:metalloregulator ArsR/SmtB family transcription factor [Oceanobacillus jordanicus]MCG3418314.1 transcriptional regulator [Oceanobacillus jordanicus]